MPRIAARALILHENKLLLVNAWRNDVSLWCLPGGGVENQCSLPDTLRREVFEETGLEISVGAPALVNEFFDPRSEFHQIEVFFRCTLLSGDPFGTWADTEGIVSKRLWAAREDLSDLPHKPDSLAEAAWGSNSAIYDPLEPIKLGETGRAKEQSRPTPKHRT